MPTATANFQSNVALGGALPPHAPHAISVSLPTWRDNVGYEEGDKRVIDKMVSGYPRFFIPLVVQKVRATQLFPFRSPFIDALYRGQLASICEQKYSFNNEKCLLLPSRKIADECRSYIERRSEEVLGKKCLARCVEERSHPHRPYGLGASKTKTGNSGLATNSGTLDSGTNQDPGSLYIVLFHPDAFAVAKEFWQHTGLGVSSRFAERFLSIKIGILDGSSAAVATNEKVAVDCFQKTSEGRGKRHNRHYSSGKGTNVFGFGGFGTGHSRRRASISGSANGTGGGEDSAEAGELGADCQTYLEERYGRNLPLCVAASAKRALRRRLAGVLIKDSLGGDCVEGEVVGSSSRVAEGDVYLFPSGMAAIWTAHQCLMGIRGLEAKSVCFGWVHDRVSFI